MKLFIIYISIVITAIFILDIFRFLGYKKGYDEGWDDCYSAYNQFDSLDD